ncbi:Rif1 [Phodopus roborovskii]|uniref:Telomere-associated protein RIF1 n=1 Tax=Phodopus roborovskii TaxID=109678 RepID=A0AAU9Z7H4_PHORO|nr:Rif1 [Phodopus roborovskii]
MTAAGRSPLEPLLETWEDPSASPGEQTDAYLTLTSRMTGEEGKEVITEIEKNLPRLYTVLKAHISSQNSELSSAALQALGFCLYNPKITSGLSEANIQELLLTLNDIIKSSDKNVCTRALWVISKQTFPSELVSKMVSSIIDSLEVLLSKGEVHSAVVDFEALNVIIRLIEQAPLKMGEESVRWAKLVIPLVVHSAQKVHLRGATALEMGMPLLLQKQQEIALITEHLMTTKLISELQKLFMSKNETYVLKLWPLFVKLLGKTLHRSGSFINSLLQLEELGFRSGIPMIKKIAFIAWKSLIDNFALNPDILCSAKRLKLLMQPLSSIHVRTETLALTKLEVWWYLLMRLGPQLPGNFEQPCIELWDSEYILENSYSLTDAVVSAIWKELISLVKSVTESGNRKERSGSEVLTLLLKSLENIVKSEVFPVSKTLVLMEITVKGLPQKVLGSPAYQVANMDILNGTPALFLIQLIFNNNLVECGVADEKFFLNLETLVGCVLSGPTSPLAFSDSVLSVINQNAKQLANKEHLWRMWSIIVTPLTDVIHQTNEVNQGDALEHNFSAIYGALTLPINHIFSAQSFPMATMKTLLKTWSELYRAFARCAALVATAEENLCCEELSSKIMCSLEDEVLSDLLFLDRISQIIIVMVDCIDFSPYNIKYQPKIKSPQRSSDWSRKKKEPLGKLASLFKLIVRVIHSFHTMSFKEKCSDALLTIGNSIISMLSNIFGHISLPSMIREIFATFTRPLALLYENSKLDEVPKVYSSLNSKLEKLLGEVVACLQYNYSGAYDSELLGQLSPLLCIVFLHKNKQIRKQSALLWNATFAKATALVYPEELKPILRQAKQKTLLLLPGLENVEMMDECSVPYSDAAENSQLNVKISGMERKSSGKRDSFLAQTKDKKENVKLSGKLKLESSSPKLKSSKLLEEEKSTDFVFIPPEGKEAKARVLTEHQKEVLKTKRCDIPALYNNLDASQDTLFSAQFSQEESMESPTLTEKSKEDTRIIKEEQMESAVFTPQDAMENCDVDEHPEKKSLPNDCGSVAETNSEMLSSDVDATKNMLISSKTKAECSSSTESPLVLNSSSVSNATVSGTPPQPTSRRQTFITLEKFDGSENRPFSPSPLNNMSSTVTVRNNQENTTKTDIPPKARKREVTHSKSDSEKLVNGSKKSGRRWSKAEQSANKKSKPSLRSEQEEHVSENKSPDLLSQRECESKNHDHPSEAVQEHEDRTPKPVVENSLLEDLNTEEKNVGINMESKENTPPVATLADQIVNEDSQAAVAANPKTLRRSSRRRAEIESSTDSQDKDNGQPKKERRKEEEKTVPKSPLHIKDDKLPKQKLPAELPVQENLTEKGNSLHDEKTIEEPNVNAEIGQNKRKSDHEDVSSEGGGTQDNVDKSSEKPLRGRTRYQTRRASQGLLSNVENSESDSSEAKEEISRKKRSGKWKNKSSDSVDIGEQEEKMVQEECIKTANETYDGQTVPEVDVDAVAQICEESTNRVILQEATGSSDSLQVTDTPVTGEDKSKTSKCVNNSFASPPVPESNLRTRNASKRLHKRDSDTVGECSKVETSDISVPSEKWAQAVECQHKRSRRVRRSKSCDCCGEKSLSQEKSFIGLKNTENCAVKNMETKTDLQAHETTHETCDANEHDTETKLVDEQPSMNFYLGLKEENATTGDLIMSETGLEEDRKNILPSEIVDKDFSETVSEIQETCKEAFNAEDPCLSDSKDTSQKYFSNNKVESPGAVLKREFDINDVGNVCKVIAGSNSEGLEAMELNVGDDTFGASFSEQKSGQLDVSVDMATEEENKDDFEAVTPEVNAEGTATEGLNSDVGFSDKISPVSKSIQTEHPARVESEVDSIESDSSSCEEMNKETESYITAVSAQLKAEIDNTGANNRDTIVSTSTSEEAPVGRPDVKTESFVCDTPEKSSEEGSVYHKTERNIELDKLDETELSGNPTGVDNDNLQEVCLTSEKVEELPQSLTSEVTSELVSENNNASPEKLRELDPSFGSANESPSGMQARCVWSPLASPSTSILKRGLKRSHEDEISSPVNKVRRVSFADPIYQAGLADDIDRRCSVVRSHSSNSSPIIKSVKTSPTSHTKHNTTSIKGFLSPGSQSSKFKSSKKCLVTEMAKESMLSPTTESVYPALVNCAASVDIILPQITSNMWARGLGQLIRAKNIKTIGDLSTLTASEIKTLPIRSPKVFNVKKALRVYHEQQMKSRGLEDIPVFDISEKAVNGVESKPLSTDEERLASDLIDPVTLDTPLSKNLMAQISALALQLDSEDLYSYSGSQLFEMHEKLGTMANSIIRNLQSRWRSPAHENS